ncbi:RNA-binding protein 25-like isoform X1 [Salvelinus namaycush]|uniref:RNA-binding protein 25-like isoform X1 n=1 Tax=Salvelinus namaycush TaxID=8040 RepID=A0A8U0TPE2_SALNM|nr:RNA-binding protein 25-like isoform X1 [Salvelinus namaycush]
MSYPPHLNRLPQLPPGICPPQFAGFPQGVPAGTPMIPVHMGIMTSAPAVLVPTTVSMVQMSPAPRKELNPVRVKENEEGGGGGPTTTVFVGNISEKASDMLVRQLLAKCGLVLSWKRVQGASGKLQGKNKTAFGFCEYKEPESTLRSLRLLHELLLGDKKLLVKVDAKTKAQLEEWKAKKRSANGGAKSEDGPKEEEDEEEVLDEDTKRRDQIVKGAIEGLIREFGSELNAPSQDGDNQPRKKKREKKEEEDINVMDIEDDKRDLISREISKFRDTHKKLEEEKGKKEQERQEIDKDRRERDKERERERERRDREREKEREKEKERNDNKERERDRDRDRDRIDRDRERTRERGDRGERERVKERSREVSKDRSGSRERSRDEKKHDREEDQEEAYERRKLERKMRDKEVAYQERLKNWEMRERKKARDYDKENQREDERRREMTKEGKRLKEFLEDYDDDKDDLKYYRGSALQKRLRDREKETELDERDRKREKEEHDQIRQRLLAEGHPDPEAELQRMEEEAERRRQPPVKPEPEEEVQQEKPNRDREHREHREREHREREHHRDRRGGGGGGGEDRPPLQHLQPQSDDDLEEGEELDDCDREDSSDARPNPNLKPTMRPITSAPSVSSGSGGATPNSPGNESPCGIIIPHENSPEARPTEEQHPKVGLSLKLGAGASPNHQIHTGSKRKKLSNVDSVFNKFGEEEADEAPRKRKLVPLDYGEDDKSLGLDGAEVPGGKGGPNTEEKRKHIRSLIEKIPTARPDLFNYPLDWTAVDSTLMERRIRPWINKKIIEYIGEEEATLVDFVCSKVMSHGTPQGILDDVAMVLDEEAEVFIVKMWRLLIYETEAKKIGLGK